tara:strand:+ start:14437 stop:15210 length:774 start_codon:yes stop_codon:yes gene_type:complete
MKDIKNNTILGEELFEYNFKESLIVHIPHSSVEIPVRDDYLISDEEINKEIIKLTDIGTDVIFNLGLYVKKIIFPYNRLFCDVERLPDDQEEMFPFGRGFFYTKTDDGRDLRSEGLKDIVEILYNSYHKDLTSAVETKLMNQGVATIIDCHSFSDTPFESDINIEDNRPDICLGTDDFHTPEWLKIQLKTYFERLGYSVKINNPYGGTIVPLKYYKKDVNVVSIMIEINRKLFIEDGILNTTKLLELNKVMKKMFTK